MMRGALERHAGQHLMELTEESQALEQRADVAVRGT